MQDWTWKETYSSATHMNGVVGVVIWAGVSKLKSGTGGDIADKRSDRIVCRTHTITPRNCAICWATIWHLWCPQALDCCTCPQDVCCLLFALSRQNIFILMLCVHWPWHTFPADLLTDTVGSRSFQITNLYAHLTFAELFLDNLMTGRHWIKVECCQVEVGMKHCQALNILCVV
jgi:hypothetical protein